MLFLSEQLHVRAAENICIVDFLLFGYEWTTKLKCYFFSYISIVYLLCVFPDCAFFLKMWSSILDCSGTVADGR